jgi:hypothetical protein
MLRSTPKFARGSGGVIEGARLEGSWIHMRTPTEETFLLTSGGHDHGIVSAAPRERSWSPARSGGLAEPSGCLGPLPPLGDAADGEPPIFRAPSHDVLAN